MMKIEWQWEKPVTFDLEAVLQLVQISNGFDCSILFRKNSEAIDGKAVSQTVSLMLAAKKEQPLYVTLEGADAGEAFLQISDYITALTEGGASVSERKNEPVSAGSIHDELRRGRIHYVSYEVYRCDLYRTELSTGAH